MIFTVIVVWGIALSVPLIRNVSIIAIMITFLGILSMSGRGIVRIVGGVVSGSVAIVMARVVPCVKVPILRFNSICATVVVLSV